MMDVVVMGMSAPVAAAAVMVVIAAALSYRQRLGLERDMAVSVLRGFVQLSVIGFVLDFVFTRSSAFWILLAYLFMVCIAAHTAGKRAQHTPKSTYIAGVSIFGGTSITLLLLLLLRTFPISPRYIIPVAGMMVGNSMITTGVAMKSLRQNIKAQKNLVETALSLGATPHQATLLQVKKSLVLALTPILDNAKTLGLVTLPGAMSGLIMGGASPWEAIRLQLVVMNMLIGASTISSLMCTYMCWPVFFTDSFQLQTNAFAQD